VPRPVPHSNSRARTAGSTHSFTVKIELDELLAFGTLLGHEDVLDNNGDMERYAPELEYGPDPTKYSGARVDVVWQHTIVVGGWMCECMEQQMMVVVGEWRGTIHDDGHGCVSEWRGATNGGGG
jgi:hypothetical protein